MKKIVIIGPESTGKSTLCEKLAEHYTTNWCPEYAREYLLSHGTDYSYDNLLEIARGQVKLEEKYIQLLEAKTNNEAKAHSPLATSSSSNGQIPGYPGSRL